MALANHQQDPDEELAIRLERLPSLDDVCELFSALPVAMLCEMSAEIVNGGIAHATGNLSRLEYAKLLNSWIATAEEIVAAGPNVSGIAARRRKTF